MRISLTKLAGLVLFAASVAFYSPSGLANTPDDPLDYTIFAPIVPVNRINYNVWVEDGMTRVFKNDPAGVNSNITLYTAKNEYEPFQIIVKAPPSSDLTNVNITISDFTGPNGAFISSDNLTLYREHYLYVTQGSKTFRTMTNSPLGPGWYPDALIPFNDPVTHQDLKGQLDAVPFNLAAGENQPIWVDIYTPANTPAGQYSAMATTTSDQGTSTVSVTLTCLEFLPT
jgi:hypothetical protein